MILGTMPRKRPEGYWVRGQFVERGSELDRELNDSDTPSKTELKRQSAELQDLGEALLTLRADLYAALDLPQNLRDAVAQARRITAHEGRRRQLQFIGKLMRQVDPEPIRQAIARQKDGSAAETQALHQAERWRDELIASDDAFTRFMAEHPGTDAQALRALARQARKDARPARPGEAPRHGRAYREIFQMVRQAADKRRQAGQQVDHDTQHNAPDPFGIDTPPRHE